jgi:acyl carrier protein
MRRMIQRDVVAAIWRDILGVDEVTDEQNFFELGGDSLMAVDFVVRVREEAGWEVPLELVFTDGRYGPLIASLDESNVPN